MRAIAILTVAVLMSSPLSAREPIGKLGLENIAPLGGDIEEARKGLAGREIAVVDGQNGEKLLVSREIIVGLCHGRIYSVTRQLGSRPEDGMSAIMQVSTLVGSPLVETTKVRGGAQGLTFSWEGHADYQITIARTEEHWASSEAVTRISICQGG